MPKKYLVGDASFQTTSFGKPPSFLHFFLLSSLLSSLPAFLPSAFTQPATGQALGCVLAYKEE